MFITINTLGGEACDDILVLLLKAKSHQKTILAKYV